MATVYQKRPAAVFIQSKSNGDRSADVVVLKQSATEYVSGSVLVAEYTESVSASGNYDTATGKYVAAVGLAGLADYDTVKVALLVEPTDASEGDVEVLVINADAEIKGSETNLSAIATGAKPLINAAIAVQGIKVR